MINASGRQCPPRARGEGPSADAGGWIAPGPKQPGIWHHQTGRGRIFMEESRGPCGPQQRGGGGGGLLIFVAGADSAQAQAARCFPDMLTWRAIIMRWAWGEPAPCIDSVRYPSLSWFISMILSLTCAPASPLLPPSCSKSAFRASQDISDHRRPPAFARESFVVPSSRPATASFPAWRCMRRLC